ncbi:MAG: hypothetical protein EZS28_024470, partial [Streblomastix strix]
MIESTNYEVQTQKQGVAEGFGLGVKNTAHTEAVFVILEVLDKKEGVMMKKPPPKSDKDDGAGDGALGGWSEKEKEIQIRMLYLYVVKKLITLPPVVTELLQCEIIQSLSAFYEFDDSQQPSAATSAAVESVQTGKHEDENALLISSEPQTDYAKQAWKAKISAPNPIQTGSYSTTSFGSDSQNIGGTQVLNSATEYVLLKESGVENADKKKKQQREAAGLQSTQSFTIKSDTSQEIPLTMAEVLIAHTTDENILIRAISLKDNEENVTRAASESVRHLTGDEDGADEVTLIAISVTVMIDGHNLITKKPLSPLLCGSGCTIIAAMSRRSRGLETKRKNNLRLMGQFRTDLSTLENKNRKKRGPGYSVLGNSTRSLAQLQPQSQIQQQTQIQVKGKDYIIQIPTTVIQTPLNYLSPITPTRSSQRQPVIAQSQ